MDVPVLETARLRLRGHRLDDFQHCAALWADPAVTYYIGGTPLTAEESWGRLLRYGGHWSMLGFGYWLAEEKSTGTFLGEVGFANYKRNLEPPLEDMPEAGWVFASAARGQGYAAEAVQAILQWGDAHFPSPQTACLIHPDNEASLRLAWKCGYQESCRAQYKGAPTILFVRSR